MKYNASVPKFRKKYVKGKFKFASGKGSDAKMLNERKEDRGLRSSSSSYKDDIDSV